MRLSHLLLHTHEAQCAQIESYACLLCSVRCLTAGHSRPTCPFCNFNAMLLPHVVLAQLSVCTSQTNA